MSFERYRAAAGASKSMLDVLDRQTPAHLLEYMKAEDEPSAAQRYGVILHRALLEPDSYVNSFHVKPDKMNFATKEGKAWRDEHLDKPLINSAEEKQISAMVSAVHTHPFAKRLLVGALTEQNVFVEDANGTLRKSRLDALTKGNVLPDVKTCETANLESFERSVSKYRYHVQAAFYLDNCNLAGIDKQSWFFVCIEKSPPYLVRCLQLMPEVIAWGRVLYQHDLQTWRTCIETDTWPGWSQDFEDIGLPNWEMKQIMNAPI